MPAVNYFWDGDNLLQEYDDAGNTLAHYVTEPGQYGNVISQRRDGQTHHFHYDGMGSTMELSDDIGDVTDARRYSPCGDIVEESGETQVTFQFGGGVGYYCDCETAGYYVRRRIYDPKLRRWLSSDPLLQQQAVAGSAIDQVAVCRQYIYADNGPTNRIDPSGLVSLLCDAGCGCAAGPPPGALCRWPFGYPGASLCNGFCATAAVPTNIIERCISLQCSVTPCVKTQFWRCTAAGWALTTWFISTCP